MVMMIHLLIISYPDGFALGENKGRLYSVLHKYLRAVHMSIRPVHENR